MFLSLAHWGISSSWRSTGLEIGSKAEVQRMAHKLARGEGLILERGSGVRVDLGQGVRWGWGTALATASQRPPGSQLGRGSSSPKQASPQQDPWLGGSIGGSGGVLGVEPKLHFNPPTSPLVASNACPSRTQTSWT